MNSENAWHEIEGGVTAPKDFVASAEMCGIKNPDKLRLDLAIIASNRPAIAHGTFTTNKVKAAPVRVSSTHLKSQNIRAIIANSGNANACTGSLGIQHARAMCRTTAKALGARSREVLVCSTGIIGLQMPIERILEKIPSAVSKLHFNGSDSAAQAIMTSDTRPKSIAVELELDGVTVRIGGIAKGAGMICPSMATMLSFITTDLAIERPLLQKAVTHAVEHTFNRISVDGDMSTNDTVLVMANGAAENAPVTRSTDARFKRFQEALTHVMKRLAKMIVKDGERVTKLVDIQVRGAATYLDAKKIAEAVAKSTLVRCSWNGSDPNWGRVIHAAGYSRARLKEELIDIYFDGLLAAKNGLAADTPLIELERVTAKPEFTVLIDLNLGDATYNIYTADLSEAYVDFNKGEYNLALRQKKNAQ